MIAETKKMKQTATAWKKCYEKFTAYQHASSGGVIYLDRLGVSCRYDYDVIQSFQLERYGSSQRYKIRCCALNKVSMTKQSKKNVWNIPKNRDILGLTYQNVNCGSNRKFLHSFLFA